MEDDLVERLSQAYRGWLSGDPAPLMSLLSSHAVYHLPGNHMGGGILRGRDVILRRAAAAVAALDAPPEVRLEQVAGGGSFVITIERIKALRAGAVLDQRVCTVWRFEQSMCVEIWARFSDQTACDSFWRDFQPS